MALTLAETQILNELAALFYEYLPATPHPYAKDTQNSFPAVAKKTGVSDFWIGGSKKPAIETLLQYTYERRKTLFCNLIEEIVRCGLSYRMKKNPVTYNEIIKLNELLLKLKLKIPALWEQAFLNGLPGIPKPSPTQKPPAKSVITADMLKVELLEIEKLEPQARGYAFEKFLNNLFEFSELNPRSPFKLTGEQIDGSIQVGEATYLIEAKWQKNPTDNRDISYFQSKVAGKSEWSRGLFISYGGFSPDSIEAFERGRSIKVIGMTGEDIYLILEGQMTLLEAIKVKSRRAAETGKFLVGVAHLLSGA